MVVGGCEGCWGGVWGTGDGLHQRGNCRRAEKLTAVIHFALCLNLMEDTLF